MHQAINIQGNFGSGSLVQRSNPADDSRWPPPNPLARLYGTFTVNRIFDEFFLVGRLTSYHLRPDLSVGRAAARSDGQGGAGHREATCPLTVTSTAAACFGLA
jgi:hypothetical protein